MKYSIPISSARLALVGLLAIVSACDSRGDATAPFSNGSLVLTLTAPNGSTPSVTVTGPDGFSRTVSSTSTLRHLAAGTYTITADSIVTPGTIVGYSVDTAAITGSPVVVSAIGSSSATVTYAFARQHGALWLANYAETHVTGFAQSQLLASSSPTAADTIGAAQFPGGIAFASNGDMWVSTDHADSLKMFTLAQRNGAATITSPARSLISPDLSSPQVMTFDSHGNLWVADEDNGLLEFTAAQVANASSTPVNANVIVTDTFPPSTGTYAIVFDAAGNAWVGENNSDNIVEYTVDQLAASGSPTPHVRLGVDQSTRTRIVGGAGATPGSARASNLVAFDPVVPQPLNDPDALAFDSQGNLWVANYMNQSVVAYTPAQVVTSGNPTPFITISIPGSNPFGVAFDKSGGLWVSDDSSGRLLGFTGAQIAASGVPTPNVVLTAGASTSIYGPQQIAFDEQVVLPTPVVAGSRAPYRTLRTARSAVRHKIGNL